MGEISELMEASAMRLMRLRGWAAVFAIAILYPAAFSMEEGTPVFEDVTLDALVDLSNATAVNGTAAAAPLVYSEIKGFALEGGGYTETTGKTWTNARKR